MSIRLLLVHHSETNYLSLFVTRHLSDHSKPNKKLIFFKYITDMTGLIMDRQVSKLCQVCYFSPASVANSATIAHQGITTHTSPRLRYESGQSLQRSPVRVSFLSSRQASVRVELGRLAGPEHPQVQPHISYHPRRAPLASNQKKDRLQDRPYGPSLLGWCCAGIPGGTVLSCWLSRWSTMSSVGFSW